MSTGTTSAYYGCVPVLEVLRDRVEPRNALRLTHDHPEFPVNIKIDGPYASLINSPAHKAGRTYRFHSGTNPHPQPGPTSYRQVSQNHFSNSVRGVRQPGQRQRGIRARAGLSAGPRSVRVSLLTPRPLEHK